MSDPFAAHWNRRHDVDPVFREHGEQRTRDERSRDYVFLVDVDDASVLEALEAKSAALAELAGVTGAPPAYFHATVKKLGVVVPHPTGDDELSIETAERLAAAAADALSDVDPFELRLPRLNVFPSVVFCEVHDDGMLAEIHERLLGLDEMPAYRYDGDNYTPHMTLAHFETDTGFERAVAWTEANREVATPPATVDAVELVDVVPREGYPTLDTVRRYELS